MRMMAAVGFTCLAAAWTVLDAAAEPRQAVTTHRDMVVAANPLAAQAGLDILRAGGNAIDAAVAVQMVLNLVEPQSSGIGGGGYLLYYDGKSHALEAYDGRETAPSAATEDMFLHADKTPMKFYEAVVGGLSVGVPGDLRLLEAVHKAHGKLPWAQLLQPAIDLADKGFAISPRLHDELADDEYLPKQPTAAAYFYQADGTAKPAGTLLQNPAFAETLRTIARDGADAFYKGKIADDIAKAVQGSLQQPGRLTAADLAAYAAKQRDPVCAPYRIWRVCGTPPSSSGGIAVLQILKLLERFDLAAMVPGSTPAVHLFAEAGRLAYADRDRYLGDPDVVSVPTAGLLDEAYLRDRSAVIAPDRDLGKAAAGTPKQQTGWAAPAPQFEPPSTSHISIVDADGDAVSFTTSIESAFGSRQMVDGFLLNNELTDFAFQPERDGQPVANRVGPGKRPRSSMAPTMVFDASGRLLLVIGSPGGPQIIPFVAKTLIAVLDWHLDPQAAVDLPNFANRNGATELEQGTALEALAPALREMGHDVKIEDMNSGLAAILVTPDGLVGGADSRREGVAVGD